MGSLWQRFGLLIFVGFGLHDASYGHPIGEIRGPSGDGDPGDWMTLWPSVLSAAFLLVAASAIGCCLCCRKNPKGFQPNERKIIKEFTDSGSSHSLSTGGYVNPAAASSPANEFTIFPPAAAPVSGSEGGGPVSFEPLPDIRHSHGANALLSANPSSPTQMSAMQQRSLQKKPAAFNNAISHGLSAQDWFDDPHANFPRSQLKYLCEFGKGWFGRVVEGEAFGLSGGDGPNSKRVIVKILHGDATPTDQMYFLHEVRYLRDLTQHPNILSLLGRCLETDPLLVMLEACPNGDLKTFLLQNLATAEALGSQGVLLRMACNVAAGLQYMHEKGFVHTDLAARNCLVDSNLTIKIGDYGTSIENFKDDYYCAGDVALPIRWCAPETLYCTDTTIVTKEVTASANIWSFGILLWEICEFGQLPYSELNDEEVIVKVLGERSRILGPPSRPCLQAHDLYHLMRICWNADSKRPTVSQVAAILDSLYLHPTELPSNSLEDFEHRWDIKKLDCNVAVVKSVVHEPPQELQLMAGEDKGKCDIELMQHNVSSHPYLPDESLELPIKLKSPSLQNLHGSLEDLAACSSSFEEDPNKMYSSTGTPLQEGKENYWLHDEDSQAVAEDDEDAQFVRKISEAIRDLDDVLALEKTSSSGSGTSPEEHSPSKKRFLQESHNKIDENGVLDFRLDEKDEVSSICINGSHNVTKKSTKEVSFNAGEINGPSCNADSIQEKRGESDDYALRERAEDSCRHNTVDDINWRIEVASERESERQRTAWAEEEEEEEDWRQQVERGEFTAKVKEKSKSVQDLMVLTHIEESSDGSDSDTGTSCGKGTIQQGAVVPSSIPSFGSVGDLRTAVLGEEFRHTLERLCAANKRGCSSQTDLQSKEYHMNLLEEPGEKREGVEILKEFNSNSANSSQINENIEIAVSLSKIESTTLKHHMQSSDNAEASLSAKENVSIEDASTSSIDMEQEHKQLVGDMKSDNNSNSILNQFQGENSKLVTSTPQVSSDKRTDIQAKDSFSLIPLDPYTSPTESNFTENSRIATANLTFLDSSETVMKTPNPEVYLFNKSTDAEHRHDVSFSDSKETGICEIFNVIDAHMSTKNQKDCTQEPEREIIQRAFDEDIESCSESLVCNNRVKSLRDLAKCCVSASQVRPVLSDGGGNSGDKEDISTDLVVCASLLGENSGNMCSGKEDRKFELLNFEGVMQDSPVSEFPGEEDGHGLSCGISGSQSTVECTSPLTLSPVTVEDSQTSKAAVMSDPCIDSITHSSNDANQFDEKFKSDGVTKEINSDFIFSSDAMVENMDAVMQPDFLLDVKQVMKEVAQKRSDSSLDDISNVSLQENVGISVSGKTEVDTNCNMNWSKSIGNDIKGTHLLLDLVQISSNGLQKLSGDHDILSSIVTANETSVERDFSPTADLSSDLKDFDVSQKSNETQREKCLEKECNQSDAPNSEECDSAGTEDSVFDFTPPENEGKSEASNVPEVKQIRFEECDGIENYSGCGQEGRRVEGAEGVRTEEEEELGLLNIKQWTPDDERSSDSGFRDKGSLSESIEDERGELEIGAEEEIALGGREAAANACSENYIPCNYLEDVNKEACTNKDEEVDLKTSQLHFVSSEKVSVSSVESPESGNQDEFWRQQMSSLRQAVGDTALLLKEASGDQSCWVKGESWDEPVRRNSREEDVKDDDGDRGLDEASLAALRSELEEKLGGSNGRCGLDQEGSLFERANSEEHLSDEEDEERTDITIHYDAYLAQLSPILEERESIGSSELYSPAAKEALGNSISDDSATTASVNDLIDNQVFSSRSNVKDPDVAVEDVLVVDMATNQASLMVSSPIDFHDNDATSPEFTDSLEEDDDDEKDNKDFEKSEKQSPENHSELLKADDFPEANKPVVRCAIPPSDFWTGMTSPDSQSRPLVGFPLLLPPPPSSAPMPSPEEEKACCVERANMKKAPMFRDFEDIVALCQNQGDDFGDCDVEALGRSDIQNMNAVPNLPFWESESSDGNDSSSSGEFVWKEGEGEIPTVRAVESCPVDPVSRVYESLSEFPMAVIEEEDEEEACDGAKEDSDSSASVMEFIPSVWNCAAEPSRSSLRSPERKSDQKKNVSFKRQKYHCVYEYPKEEASDSEGECPPASEQWGSSVPSDSEWKSSSASEQWTSPLPLDSQLDYSRYADWELMESDIPEGIVPGDLDSESEGPNTPPTQTQFDFYKLSSEDFDFGFGTVTPETAEGEFMVSSSSRPFQYCPQDSSYSVGSQFFPGLNLSTNSVPGWVNGSRFPWSKNGEESLDVSESAANEMKSGDNVPDLLVNTVPKDMCQGDSIGVNVVPKSAKDGALDWSPQQPSLWSPPASPLDSPLPSPLSPTGLGELRHTRDRLKLDLGHKFHVNEVARGSKKEDAEEAQRRRAEERGEASVLDVEGITKTAL